MGPGVDSRLKVVQPKRRPPSVERWHYEQDAKRQRVIGLAGILVQERGLRDTQLLRPLPTFLDNVKK